MYVDLEFDVNSPNGISVPQEAVLDTGMGKTVYVEIGEGIFEPRSVQLGSSVGSRVAVTKGLSDGERYVASGNFLVDSESRLRGAPIAATNAANAVMGGTQLSEKDPVCGMKLSEAQAQSPQHQESYHGEKFHFCSDNCQSKFRNNPARYAPNSAAASNSEPDDRSEARR
jgi:YHS domain-containing protein